MRVAVIHAGNTGDVLRESFQTREWEGYEENAKAIAGILCALGHEVHILTEGKSLPSLLEFLQIEVAWVCSAGIQGRNSAAHLPGILEMLGTPYVGSPPLAAAIADHKPTAKLLAQSRGIPTPKYCVVASPEDALSMAMTYPCVVKPVHGLCACGVYRVHTEAELTARIAELNSRYKAEVMIEQFVGGVDITVPVVQVKGVATALAPLQRSFLWPGDPCLDRSAFRRDHPLSMLLEGPAREVPPGYDVSEAVKLAINVFTSPQLRHLARIDFRLNECGPHFLEANYKPDLRASSLFATSAELSGWTYDGIMAHLLHEAVHEATTATQ